MKEYQNQGLAAQQREAVMGMLNMNAKPTKESSRLEILASKLDSLNADVSKMHYTVETIMEALYGYMPQNEEVCTSTPSPQGSLVALECAADRLALRVRELDEAISKLRSSGLV